MGNKSLATKIFSLRYLILAIILAFACVPFDHSIGLFIAKFRWDALDPVMTTVTRMEVIWILLFLLFIPFLVSPKKRALLFPLWGSIAVALFAAHAAKNLLLTERPDILALTVETSPRFPSLHTAIMFSVIPILATYLKAAHKPWLLLALLIAFSRLYVGVHFLSDIFGGIAIGLASGMFFVWLEEKKDLSKRILKIHFELRRQIAHMVIGFITIVGVDQGLISVNDIAVVLGVGLALVLIYKKYPDRVPIITPFLTFFERKEDRQNFPGKGSFFLVLGIFLSLLIFEKHIALATIAILSVGDAITNVVGRHFGEIENPLNPKKTIEGSMAGFFCALGVASFFVSFWPAFFGSLGAILVESLDLKIGRFKIDDNLVIPLAAGWILTLWYG